VDTFRHQRKPHRFSTSFRASTAICRSTSSNSRRTPRCSVSEVYGRDVLFVFSTKPRANIRSAYAWAQLVLCAAPRHPQAPEPVLSIAAGNHTRRQIRIESCADRRVRLAPALTINDTFPPGSRTKSTASWAHTIEGAGIHDPCQHHALTRPSSPRSRDLNASPRISARGQQYQYRLLLCAGPMRCLPACSPCASPQARDGRAR
jgi:hypothetical protein